MGDCMQGSEVYEALEILLEEIELVANELNDEGAKAFRSGDYEAARRAIEKAARLAEFRNKVKALKKEWNSIMTQIQQTRKKSSPRLFQVVKKRLPKGLRTSEDTFRLPILEALIELGGKASASEVLDLVEKKLSSVLKECDYEPLPSNPKSIRWRNTAQ